MFRDKTLFIIGAGASCEVGMPLGRNLRTKIAEALDLSIDSMGRLQGGDKAIRIIVSARNDLAALVDTAQRIATAMSQTISIDNYIEAHEGDAAVEFLGKLAIVSTILGAERECDLSRNLTNGRINFGMVENTWFNIFMQMLCEGVPKARVGDVFRQVAMVVFNYDRCIEHFCKEWLTNYYRLDETEAVNITNTLKIWHPYGRVGRLSWQPGGGNAFGAEPVTDQMLSLAEQIKTFSERVSEATVLDEIRQAVATYPTAVFLGFGYIPQNLKLLEAVERTAQHRVFGIAFEISSSNLTIIQHHQISAVFGRVTDSVIGHAKCAAFLVEHSRHL